MKPAGRSGIGYDAIQTALAKVIHLHNDFPAVLRENKDGKFNMKMVSDRRNFIDGNKFDTAKISGNKSKKICNPEKVVNNKLDNKGADSDIHEEVREGVSRITNEVILEQIELEAKSLGVDASVAARSLVLAQVKVLARLLHDEHDYMCDLEGLVTTTRFLVARKILTTTDIGEQLLNETAFLGLSLTSLWRFTNIGVVSLEQIIKCIHDSGNTTHSIVDGLFDLILHGRKDHVDTSAVSDILSVLICIAYDSAEDDHASLCKFANQALCSLTTRLLNHILNWETEKREYATILGTDSTSLKSESKCKGNVTKSTNELSEDGVTEVMNIYELVLNNLSITSEALELYCSGQLMKLLTHCPELQLGRVLRHQEKWRSTKANTALSAWMQKLLVALGYEAALSTLEMVVNNEEVNWACVLTLVATALNCHRATVAILKGMIERNIRRGCEEQEMDSLIIGFLFARHAGQEGRHIFPSYSQWFNTLFATESGSPVPNKQAFTFLIHFLTELVPHEPAYCLRAHLTNQIFVPKGCQEVLREYCYLARARLQELKDTQHIDSSHLSTHALSTVADEVEAAVNHFSQTGKIPNFVTEASIFRNPYFRSSFLPALLAPRPLPDVPDSRAKLISALHSTGKIPSNMFNYYVEACQKEASDLLTGVFIDVKEDIIIEDPVTELSHQLQDLIKEATSCQDRDKTSLSAMLPTLSRISHKIEEIMKLSDSKLRHIKYLSLDARKFNTKLVSYQVTEKIIETVQKLCITSTPEKSIRKTRPYCLSQFVSLVSSSITLQCAFFTHLLHTLRIGQHDELPDEQSECHGIIMSELWKIEGLFLPVIDASVPEQKPQSFITFYLHKLQFNSYQACIFACSILNTWLQWSIVTEDQAYNIEPPLPSLPAELLNLYCCIAPRLALISSHQDEREKTVADVYLCLEGCDVPRCSELYFQQTAACIQQHKIPLEKWIAFELQATWAETSIDVQQAYLKCRVLKDFVSADEDVGAGNTVEMITTSDDISLSLTQIIIEMVFTFLKVGLKKENSSEILLLIQSLAQHNLNPSICLLEEWYKRHTERTISDISVLSFMSICRCLPPALFLRGEQLLHLSVVLKSLVDQLQAASQDLQLNLCDTVFLCSSLLSAAASPVAKNLQVQQCLMPLRTAIVFHWESLSSFFKNHSTIINKHSCLEILWNTLKTLSLKTITSLSPEEAGIRLLALTLRTSVSEPEIKAMVSIAGGPVYVKWLLAHIGLQQMRGSFPFFPDNKKTYLDMPIQSKRIISFCQEELHKILAVSEPAKLVSEIFPQITDTHLALKSIPTACVLVLLCSSSNMPNYGETDIKDSKKVLKQFDLLLHCHFFLSRLFDYKGGLNDDSELVNTSLARRQVESQNLEYLATLNCKIFSQLSKIPPKILVKLSKNTFFKCDSELQAAIKFKLQV